jgi:hypothetical protein
MTGTTDEPTAVVEWERDGVRKSRRLPARSADTFAHVLEVSGVDPSTIVIRDRPRKTDGRLESRPTVPNGPDGPDDNSV